MTGVRIVRIGAGHYLRCLRSQNELGTPSHKSYCSTCKPAMHPLPAYLYLNSLDHTSQRRVFYPQLTYRHECQEINGAYNFLAPYEPCLPPPLIKCFFLKTFRSSSIMHAPPKTP